MTITPATHAISINPATGEQLSVLPWAGADDIENALQLAAAVGGFLIVALLATGLGCFGE